LNDYGRRDHTLAIYESGWQLGPQGTMSMSMAAQANAATIAASKPD
jgi:hypothetical protein